MGELHNPDCSQNRCRACLGYGVVVLGRGPGYRACMGEEAEAFEVNRAIRVVGKELDATPFYEFRQRRDLRRARRALVRREAEILDGIATAFGTRHPERAAPSSKKRPSMPEGQERDA
jgi:hypothetical protein